MQSAAGTIHTNTDTSQPRPRIHSVLDVDDEDDYWRIRSTQYSQYSRYWLCFHLPPSTTTCGIPSQEWSQPRRFRTQSAGGEIIRTAAAHGSGVDCGPVATRSYILCTAVRTQLSQCSMHSMHRRHEPVIEYPHIPRTDRIQRSITASKHTVPWIPHAAAEGDGSVVVSHRTLPWHSSPSHRTIPHARDPSLPFPSPASRPSLPLPSPSHSVTTERTTAPHSTSQAAAHHTSHLTPSTHRHTHTHATRRDAGAMVRGPMGGGGVCEGRGRMVTSISELCVMVVVMAGWWVVVV